MSQMMPLKTATLSVPGADLYYEVRGVGPMLVMMPGGPADHWVFRDIVGHLAPDYTVVTYDPRGLSRSNLEGGPTNRRQIVQVFADDVHRLMAHLTKKKAFVFASSGGATIGLELAARHSDQIDTIVLHEPPSPSLLRNETAIRAEMNEVVEIYRKGDFGPAMHRFAVMAGFNDEGPPPAPEGEQTPEMVEAMAMMQNNMALFFTDYMEAIANYEPDIEALRKASCRIVPGVGEDSAGMLAHDGALGLAERLGIKAAVFPGAHGGFETHGAAFAAKLREVVQS